MPWALLYVRTIMMAIVPHLQILPLAISVTFPSLCLQLLYIRRIDLIVITETITAVIVAIPKEKKIIADPPLIFSTAYAKSRFQ